MSDTLAARLREAYLGTDTGDAVPFDELKPAVCDRWQRVADAARVPAEVPFSDAQIERMANTCCNTFHGLNYWIHTPYQHLWRSAIRAALAAGGLEPCAVPGYEPDSTHIIADLHKQLEAARREVDEVRRHISVTMSREHQARKEAGEAKRELAALHPGETVEGVIMERDHYRIRLERADADLRECAGVPAGWELDVTAVDMWNRYNETDEGTIESMQAVLDLCHSRIRPAFECKECARLRDEVTFWKRENVASNNKMMAARAALEGE